MNEANEVSSPIPPKAWLDVAEAAADLGVSRMSLYRLIAANKFPAVRIGTRIRIPSEALTALSAAAMQAGAVIDTADWREVLMTG
ncbi:helix-turn-helix domain-containing protein [Kribbella endophytica]